MTRFLAAVAALVFAALPLAAHAQGAPQDTLILETSKGTVIIQMRPDLAPRHVEQIRTLAREGFYNGTPFHRVIDGFMAQGGDPTGTGMGSSQLSNIPAEFTDANFGRGAVGMARADDPNSANSQFFICFQDCSFLNRQYTVWGQVVEGMEVVDALNKGEPPATPDTIITARIGSDPQ